MYARLIVISTFLLHACAATETTMPKAVFIIVDGIPADVVEAVKTPALDLSLIHISEPTRLQ